ncbi:hypothetical protein ZYGR_0P03980 [Zygosaccharomyces rouxii]|uniref:ZYRO0E09636p n=2 Tax=Zygosaccharomyces rouxii TaxID=4956 RepID=C5E4Y1_ZYGRC|nr:uncharacterized protein ZYRO0E09636g [Zygosaccharomyces rouxii]KAH9198053.1 Di-sulfide bridge nucleocytoplasmic transport domain-containing protein [Zygosaccharomyces rouxii]GAV49752.1 hypothetical protein ZYGR_0P03980 [Zygosaccharomyces rouxii]CAR31092.1 ZYRO0E09636p [Zygosaccharomyces rouxii]
MTQLLTQSSTSNNASHIGEFVRLAFNSSILVIILSVVIKFILLIKQDVDQKVQLKIAEQVIRVKRCQKHYEDNGCVSHVPALETLCDGWHHCMHSTGQVQSASLWTQTLAETLNAFVEAISFRSLVFVLLAVCALVLVTNVVIASYRVQYYIRGDRMSTYQPSNNARIE